MCIKMLKCTNWKEMDNDMLCYVSKARKIMKGANGRSSYEGGEMITILVNVNISFFEFVLFVCAKEGVEPNLDKFQYTCKFDLSLLVLLQDEEDLRKILRFNDMYCYLYFSQKIEVINGATPPARYIA